MIQIDNIDDFVGICEFFEGIRKNHMKLTRDNFQTISELSKLSGFSLSKYITDSQINDSNITEVLTNSCLFLNQKKNQQQDLSKVQDFLSDYYDKLVDLHSILINLDIALHRNIIIKSLQKAQQKDHKQFPYSKFIDFLIYAIKNHTTTDHLILLSQFYVSDFTINDIQRLLNTDGFDDQYFNRRQNEYVQLYLKNHQMKTQEELIAEQTNLIRELKSNLESQDKQLKSNDRKLSEIIKN